MDFTVLNSNNTRFAQQTADSRQQTADSRLQSIISSCFIIIYLLLFIVINNTAMNIDVQCIEYILRNEDQWENDPNSSIKRIRELYRSAVKSNAGLHQCQEIDNILLLTEFENWINRYSFINEKKDWEVKIAGDNKGNGIFAVSDIQARTHFKTSEIFR